MSKFIEKTVVPSVSTFKRIEDKDKELHDKLASLMYDEWEDIDDLRTSIQIKIDAIQKKAERECRKVMKEYKVKCDEITAQYRAKEAELKAGK